MKNTLIAIILFTHCAEAADIDLRGSIDSAKTGMHVNATPPNTLVPLKFITSPHNTHREMVYKKDFLVMWTFRSKKSFPEIDFQSMEYTLSATNMFQESLKTFVLKDTVMSFAYDMLPPDDYVLLTLEGKAKDIKTGKIISFKARDIVIRKWKEPIAKMDTLLAAEPSSENSQKIVEEFLSLDMLLNALAQYYNHPEYRTPNYDKFFKDYFAVIIQDRKPKITLKDLGYFIEYIPRN